ncbi:MAG TPA: ECF-type sigma factor [Bryobacteraceae bacterium]|jgi:RNA polymerase sigma factor (TIGR02999 family)
MVVSESVTELLTRWREGHTIHARVMPLVYADLRRMAGGLFSKERPEHSLQATGLVHEAYIRLITGGPFANRKHFFGAAANAMRQALVDHARRRDSNKRGGGLERVELNEASAGGYDEYREILAVDAALARLEVQSSRQYELVKLRYFAGLTLRETAEVLDISLSTAKDDWAKAKAWMQDQLKM